MKWSWVHSISNRALTTVRGRDTQSLHPDKPPNPVTSQRASGPEQTCQEKQMTAVKAKKALLVGNMEQRVIRGHRKLQSIQGARRGSLEVDVVGRRNHENVCLRLREEQILYTIFFFQNEPTLPLCQSYWYKGGFLPVQSHPQTLLNTDHV